MIIPPLRNRSVSIDLPPSKSYTHRALVAAALASGTSTIINPSRSDDTILTAKGLAALGVPIRDDAGSMIVSGRSGRLSPPDGPIDVRGSGTTMRFLAACAALAPGLTTLAGDERMSARPMGPLLSGLAQAGIRSESRDGFPPVSIHGGSFEGGEIRIDPGASSQFISALLLIAPYAGRATTIRLSSPPVSESYIGMTLDVMRRFGASPRLDGPLAYVVDPAYRYAGREYAVEADASAATVFGAAAAITGAEVRLSGIPADSRQGDLKFFDLLASMGCRVEGYPATASRPHDSSAAGTITVRGPATRGIHADMSGCPDAVPALAVAAAFMTTPTTIEGIAHLAFKESDRIDALAAELGKIGATVRRTSDSLIITPGPGRPARIETYNDHRIAMNFAAAGLMIPGLDIVNPECVSKSYPQFWKDFARFTDHSG